MAQTVKREYIFKLMQEHELIYFVVTDNLDRDKIGEQQSEMSVKSAITSLEDILENCEGGGTVFISLSAKSKKVIAGGGDNKSVKYKFRIKVGSETETTKEGGISAAILRELQKNKELELQIEKMKFEAQLKEIKDKIDEKNSSSVWEEYLPLIAQFLTAKIQGQVPVTGANDSEIPHQQAKERSEKLQRLEAVIVRFAKIDKDYLSVIEGLVKFAEENPEKYKLYKNML